MTGLAPLVMILWVLITISLFFRLSPPMAVLISIFGGILFVPVYAIDFPGLPEFNKSSVIAVSILLGEILSGSNKKYHLQLRGYDLPMVLWCFASPMLSSLNNQLGFYNGLSGILGTYLEWGVFYWAGRRYFCEKESIFNLTLAFIIGGLVYIPLIFFELRMSPRLNIIIYGYFAHDWVQHFRYGGYRPIVFMQHGIVVAVFMSAASIMSFWMWKSKTISHIGKIPISFVTLALIITTILCKTATAWFFLVIGIGTYYIMKLNKSINFIKLIIFSIPLYILVRITNIITAEMIQSFAFQVTDAERVGSLAWRMLQEDLFSIRALIRPLLGWGQMGRAWPIDPTTGEMLVKMIDAMWLIIFANRGLFGLVSMYLALGIGPWLILNLHTGSDHGKTFSENTLPTTWIALSLLAIFFLLDSLFNGMVNPMFILCSGSLVSYYLADNKNAITQENFHKGIAKT